jgi:single-strand DNA-binding protein
MPEALSTLVLKETTMDMNQFILDGNLTRAPEVRYTTSGMPVCTFTVASHTVYGSGDDRREETAFIPVTTYGKLAETSYRNLRKGAAVTVMGRLGSWFNGESRKGGFNFNADQVIFRNLRRGVTQEDAAAIGAAGPQQATVQASPHGSWIEEFDTASKPLAH